VQNRTKKTQTNNATLTSHYITVVFDFPSESKSRFTMNPNPNS